MAGGSPTEQEGSVCRQVASRGVRFSGHYGRAAVLIGVPQAHTKGAVFTARCEFIRDKYRVRRTAARLLSGVSTDAATLLVADHGR